jgi:TRAP-type C4-dicarboxylate transport system permease small subunit
VVKNQKGAEARGLDARRQLQGIGLGTDSPGRSHLRPDGSAREASPKEFKNMFFRLTKWVTHGLEIAIVACLTLMAILVFGNVVLRYAFDSSIAVSEELARLLFVWLIFLGAILASRQHAHIGFDTLVKSLPTGWKKAMIALSGSLMLAACVIFVIGGWKQTVINLDNSYPVLGISYAWLHGVSIVFGIGMAISILFNLWDALTRKHTDEELILTLNLGDRIELEMEQVAVRERAEKLK